MKKVEEEFPHKEVKKIVNELQKEGLIEINRKNGIISID
jgi:Mn-dependent DtxR family transcriptional regulator